MDIGWQDIAVGAVVALAVAGLCVRAVRVWRNKGARCSRCGKRR